MNTFGLTKQQFEGCIYSSGYIALLISKLVEAYEAYEFEFMDMHKIINEDLFVIAPVEYDNKIYRKAIELKELKKEDLICLGIDPKRSSYKRTIFLPPTLIRGKIDVITNGIDEATLNRYPYIQEFIDFLYKSRISCNDDVLFTKNMKVLLKDFILRKKGEINHYIDENHDKQDNECVINQAYFSHLVTYILKNFAPNLLGCCHYLGKLRKKTDDGETYEIVNEHDILTTKNQFSLCTFIGSTDDINADMKKMLKESNLPIQHYILKLIRTSPGLFEEVPALGYLFCRLYPITREKKVITPLDIDPILGEIRGEYIKYKERERI